jgi:hypothetical protein
MTSAQELINAVVVSAENWQKALTTLYTASIPIKILGICELVRDYAPICGCSCHKETTVGCELFTQGCSACFGLCECGELEELVKCSTCDEFRCDECLCQCAICDQAAFCSACEEEESCGMCEQAVCAKHIKECANCGEMRCSNCITCCCGGQSDEDHQACKKQKT